jgi:VCBS repeat protein/FG-GAP repeat protein
MRHCASTFLLGLTIWSVGAGNASGGQFRRAVYYRAGQSPYRVAAAEFTHSGNLDLALADWLSSQVVILLGNGDGTFQPPLRFSAPNPLGIAAGDFNEDGNLDLAVVETNGTGDGALAIFLGDGTGGFKLAASYPIGVESVNVAVADFNGDGHLDAAVTDQGFEGRGGDVIVFFGNGHGKLARAARFTMSQGPVGIAAGDLNGDHRPDLAVTEISTGSVAVFLNDGTGHFLKPVTYNAGGGEVVDVKIADLRHDGRNDMVVANGSRGMVVLLNNGNGTFGKPAIYPPCAGEPPCEAPQAVVVADFNRDGHLDAAVATNIDDSYFYYGKGDGTFGKAIHLKDTIHYKGGYSIAAGDFNSDGAPDLAIPIEEYGKVAILLNTQ